ncbi:MAG: adenylate/guanylate cyclase domain-containing protein [Rickettsiales bacterium]|nr:adenylate/guanylate cyclase domain-containing protein [Rickettsiales bacterium]RPG16184.1 MAG: adenylate/guanylate cyclase domain-containing protein [Pelagibacteraceae bacterium TMED195]|tara:strand:- start:57 stop:2369 length:2313 start_codon:yes stop_codon:yes gene_type:complete
MKKNKKPEDIKTLKAEISRSKLLLDISRKIASIKNLSEILWTIVEFVTKNVDADRGTLFLNDEETNELYSRVAQGDLTREIRILNTVGIAGGIFQSQVGEIIHDVYLDERFNKDVDQETGYKTKNMICSPVRTVNGKIIGVIQVLNKNKGRFTKDNLEFVNSVATQAAVSIQNAQNNEFFEKKRAQEMEFISIVSDVTAEIDLSALLKRVMEEATRMLNADRATLFLNDEKTNELFSRVAMGEGMGEIRLPNTAGIAGSVFTSGKTMNIPYAYADLRFNPAFDKQTGYFTRSILCVPVTNKNGKVIGCTQVLNKKGGKFTEEDESRLKAFTQQVAIALENAKLFDDVSKSRKYNESMLSSMSNGVITIDGDGKIVTCNKSGLKIFKVNEKNLIGLDSNKFFIEQNQWIEEKINLVRDSKEPELIMDAEIEVFNHETEKNEIISVNLTILPLINEDSDGRTDEKESFLGILLMIEDISSEKRMKSTMSRYMDPGIADQLLEDGADIMGGLDTTATLLFSDLRSFTNITESLGAQGTVKLLNEYFEIMVECISEQGGMLDKFIGDAIMAAFGLPISHEDDEDRGVKAGINMIKRLWDWNDQREKDGKPPLDMGLGLNTDKIVAGNIGSQKRMDYTMIGDGVNLAARLESACKQYNARILISDFTFKKLKGTYRIRYIDDVVVKGKTEPVGVHEVLDYHSEKTFPNLMDVVNHFNEGRKKYISGDFNQAITSFKECLKINSEDKLSETYIDRCNQLISEKPKNWDGVWVMKSK